ncbi:Angio-associated migratory cell protein [Blattella germanica]|nr:Angio-associated migratory cell protein [Blattella germanica]
MKNKQTDTPPPSPNLVSPDMEENIEDDLEYYEDLSDNDLEEVEVEGAAETSVLCCQLEPTAGVLAVTGGVDDIGYVWSTQTGEIVLKCTGHNDTVVDVGFSYDGTYVATGDMGGTVRVWKIANKSLVWEGNVDNLEWLQWHHGANVLMCGTFSGLIYMWRIPGGNIKVLPSRKRAAAGYEDGSLKVFDLKSGAVLHSFPKGEPHNDDLLCMDCHPGNNLLITGDVDGLAVERHKLNLDTGITRLTWDKTNPLVYAGKLDGCVVVYDARSGSVERQILGHSDAIMDLSLSRVSNILLTTSDDSTARVFAI